MNPLSIKQYQERYPRVTGVPSITQTGSLAAVLERIEQKRARRQRRRALRRKIARRISSLWQSMQRRIARRLEKKNRNAIASTRRTA